MKTLAWIRSFFAGLFFLGWTAVWSTLAVVEALILSNRAIGDWIVYWWSWGTLKMFGIRLEAKGLENIPIGSCLFIFNHTSFLDIFAMNVAYPHFRFGAKIELFSIPLFGAAMRRYGVLPIARQRKEEVFKVYEDAKQRTANGEKFALSPEGGRNTEEKLLPFKAGPFLFAIGSGMPLVPVIIKGANDVMGKGQILPNSDQMSRTISVEYLRPIPVTSYTPETRTELQNIAYKVMAPYFN